MIPDDVRRFVLLSIPSVPHLEAAILFHRSPDRPRGAPAVAAALYLPPARAAAILEDLRETGLLDRRDDAGEDYRYQPRTPELAALFDRVAATYAADLVGVTRLIHDAAAKSAQRFADAFRWRKTD